MTEMAIENIERAADRIAKTAIARLKKLSAPYIFILALMRYIIANSVFFRSVTSMQPG